MKNALRSVGLPSLALALETYQVWLLNNGIFPVTSETFPLAREFQTLVGIVVGLAVLFCALRRPDFIKARAVPPIVFACAVAGSGLLLCVSGSPAAVTAGLMLLSLAGAANHYLIGIAFAHADSPKHTSIGVACAALVATLVTTVSPAPSFRVSVVADAGITLSTLLLLWREVTPCGASLLRAKRSSSLRWRILGRSFRRVIRCIFSCSFFPQRLDSPCRCAFLNSHLFPAISALVCCWSLSHGLYWLPTEKGVMTTHSLLWRRSLWLPGSCLPRLMWPPVQQTGCSMPETHASRSCRGRLWLPCARAIWLEAWQCLPVGRLPVVQGRFSVLIWGTFATLCLPRNLMGHHLSRALWSLPSLPM